MQLALRLARRFSKGAIDYKTALETHYRHNDLLTGQFAKRHPKIHSDHWRTPKHIASPPTLSGLGVGTYMGEASNQYDYTMFRGLVDSIRSGINVLDTCPLFRFGKSQKVISAVLNFMIKEQGYRREEFWVGTKCGYVPADIDSNLSEKDFIRALVDEKVIENSDVVQQTHCISPGFLDFTIEKSRMSLGLQTIDVAYLNNFSEAHLAMVGEEKTYERFRLACRKFEEMRKENRIRYYGICSYVGLRSPQTEQGVHFKLQKALKIAKKEGGADHGLRFVMVPFSLGLPQILYGWQDLGEGESKEAVSIFDVCTEEKVNVVGCQPFFQGQYADLPFTSPKLSNLQHTSAKHLQVARSLFHDSYLNTLVGQTQPDHIEKNMTVVQHPRLTKEEWLQVLQIPQ